MNKIKAGIVGCGTISQVYCGNLVGSKVIDLCACADMFPEKARATAEQFGIAKAMTVEELIADPEIQLVINLTIPAAHKEINMKALAAGKHVYCEKPLATTYADAKETVEFARSKGLVIGGAPDTILGAGVQTVKKLVDDGWIGKPLSGTANFYCAGHEIWHPEPNFLYKKGAGPVWDTFIYYIAAMIVCLGSVKKVSCFQSRAADQRVIRSQPHAGELIDVEIPTYYSGTMVFENDVTVSYSATFDVWSSHLPGFEIYGSEGTVTLSNPIIFTSDVKLIRGETILAGVSDLVGPAVIETLQSEKVHGWYSDIQLPYSEQGANLRGLGPENLARHLLEGAEFVTNADFALHIIQVMEAMDTAAAKGEIVSIDGSVAPSKALPLGKGIFL